MSQNTQGYQQLSLDFGNFRLVEQCFRNSQNTVGLEQLTTPRSLQSPAVRLLLDVFSENNQNNGMDLGNDGISWRVARDTGFETPEAVADLLATISNPAPAVTERTTRRPTSAQQNATYKQELWRHRKSTIRNRIGRPA